jgi:hypothetical protein
MIRVGENQLSIGCARAVLPSWALVVVKTMQSLKAHVRPGAEKVRIAADPALHARGARCACRQRKTNT